MSGGTERAPLVSVVIVSFNCREHLRVCLLRLGELALADRLEVIVVDNSSSDGTVGRLQGEFPGVRWIANQDNRGFAAACNQGLVVSAGRFFWLLNPDTEVPDGSLEALLAPFGSPEVGATGGRQETASGKFIEASRRRAPEPIRAIRHFASLLRPGGGYDGYEMRDLPREAVAPVDAVSGACMLFSREVFERAGFLDERFFFMGEDLDYCLRIREADRRIIYVGTARIVHHHGVSRRKTPWRIIAERQRAMIHYYRKHLAAKTPALLRYGVYGGIVILGLVRFLQNVCANSEERR